MTSSPSRSTTSSSSCNAERTTAAPTGTTRSPDASRLHPSAQTSGGLRVTACAGSPLRRPCVTPPSRYQRGDAWRQSGVTDPTESAESVWGNVIRPLPAPEPGAVQALRKRLTARLRTQPDDGKSKQIDGPDGRGGRAEPAERHDEAAGNEWAMPERVEIRNTKALLGGGALVLTTSAEVLETTHAAADRPSRIAPAGLALVVGAGGFVSADQMLHRNMHRSS